MSRVERSGLIDPHAGERRAARLGDPADAFELGVSLERRGDFAWAVAAYQRAAEHRNITSNLGDLLVRHGELENAAEVYRRAIERHESEVDGALPRDAAIASATLPGLGPETEDEAAGSNGAARRATDATYATSRTRRWPAALVLIAALAVAAITGLVTTDRRQDPVHRSTVATANRAAASVAPALPVLLPPAPNRGPKRAAAAKHKHRHAAPKPAPVIAAAVVAQPSKPALVAAAPHQAGGGGGSGFVSAGGGGLGSFSGGGGGSAPSGGGSSGGGGGSSSAGGGSSSSPPPSSKPSSPPSGTGTASGTDAGSGTGTASGGG